MSEVSAVKERVFVADKAAGLTGLRRWLRQMRSRAGVRWVVILALLTLVVAAAFVSLLVGPVSIAPQAVLSIIWERLGFSGWIEVARAHEVIVLDIRLTRVLLAVIVGAGLAIAGATMQGVFRNPLADPGIIGVSGGGAIGAILMIVLGSRFLPFVAEGKGALYAVPLAAMVGAVLMTWLVYRLSLSRGQVDLVSMLLVGIAINALGGALIGLMTFISTDEELRTMTFWGLGSLGRANWDLLIPGVLFIVVPLLALPRFAHALNALLLSEQDAHHMGIDVAKTKKILIAFSASVVGATVALCGTIGFIALIAPHMMRSLLGPDHRSLLPSSALAGAALLLLADLGARTVAAPAELPLGIVTALLGAPVFLFLLMQYRRRNAV